MDTLVRGDDEVDTSQRVSSPGPGGQGWQYAKAEACASLPGHCGLPVETRPVGIIRTVSPAPHGLPRLLQQPSPSFPLSRLSELLAQLGLTLVGYCSLVALWWSHGSNRPGFEFWLSLRSYVP